jgi:hypothetical protein
VKHLVRIVFLALSAFGLSAGTAAAAAISVRVISVHSPAQGAGDSDPRGGRWTGTGKNDCGIHL